MRRPHTPKGTLPFLRLLPNLMTMLGLCAGLTAIRFVMADKFELAAALIIVAAVIDALDGRLARRLKATSEFGGELDSLSDFLCFGVAPAILVFEHTLNGARGIGWMAALIFASCCCLRLARFNVSRDDTMAEHPPTSRTYFVGVPAPAGALMALLPVFLTFESLIDSATAPITTAVYVVLVAAAMISTIPTFSPKAIYIPREKILWLLIATPAIAGLMLTRFWLSMVIVDLAYALSLGFSFALAVKRRRTRRDAPTDEP